MSGTTWVFAGLIVLLMIPATMIRGVVTEREQRRDERREEDRAVLRAGLQDELDRRQVRQQDLLFLNT